MPIGFSSLNNSEIALTTFRHMNLNGMLDVPTILTCRRVCKLFEKIFNSLLDPSFNIDRLKQQFLSEKEEVQKQKITVLRKLKALLKEKEDQVGSIGPTIEGKKIVPLFISIVEGIKGFELPRLKEHRECYLLKQERKKRVASQEYLQIKADMEPVIRAVEEGRLSPLHHFVMTHEEACKLKKRDICYRQIADSTERALSKEKELRQVFTEKVTLENIYHIMGGRLRFNALPEIKMDIDRISLDVLKGPITRGVDNCGKIYVVIRGEMYAVQRFLFQVFFQVTAGGSSWSLSLHNGCFIDASSYIVEEGHALKKERRTGDGYSYFGSRPVKGAFTQLEELVQNRGNDRCVIH